MPSSVTPTSRQYDVVKSPGSTSPGRQQQSKSATKPRNRILLVSLLFAVAVVIISIIKLHNWNTLDTMSNGLLGKSESAEDHIHSVPVLPKVIELEEQMKMLQNQVAEMKASHEKMKASQTEMKASHEKMKLLNAEMKSSHTQEITKLRAALELSHTDKNSMMANGLLDKNSEKRLKERVPSAPAAATTTPKVRYHIVFSTSCNNQDWQAYIMFYHALKSGQSGTVTRVASGCSEEAGKRLQELFQKEIKPMLSTEPIYSYKNNYNDEKKHNVDGFYLHLTPDYQHVKPGSTYVYFNKAFGIRHWLEHGIKYTQNSKQYENDIFIILDPDQIPVRPFSKDMSPSTQKNVLFRQSKTKPRQKSYKVQHGTPFGQEYGFSPGYQWFPTLNMAYIVFNTTSQNELPSPVNNLTRDQARDNYPVGPPYVMTGKDFYTLVNKWAEFAPQVFDVRPGHITEMHAYSIAAAHLELSHTIMRSYMISNYNEGLTESWELIDGNFNETEVCMHPERDNYFMDWDLLPFTFHFCKRFMLGKWFFRKYEVPKNFISCSSPLLTEPPVNVVDLYDFAIPREGTITRYPTRQKRKRIGFLLCQLIFAVNEAAIHYKKHNCDPNTVNMQKSFVFYKNMEIPANLSKLVEVKD